MHESKARTRARAFEPTRAYAAYKGTWAHASVRAVTQTAPHPVLSERTVSAAALQPRRGTALQAQLIALVECMEHH